jgi:hypothetical protein
LGVVHVFVGLSLLWGHRADVDSCLYLLEQLRVLFHKLFFLGSRHLAVLSLLSWSHIATHLVLLLGGSGEGAFEDEMGVELQEFELLVVGHYLERGDLVRGHQAVVHLGKRLLFGFLEQLGVLREHFLLLLLGHPCELLGLLRVKLRHDHLVHLRLLLGFKNPGFLGWRQALELGFLLLAHGVENSLVAQVVTAVLLRVLSGFGYLLLDVSSLLLHGKSVELSFLLGV